MCKCGCDTCETKTNGPLLTESKVKSLLSENLIYHIDNKIPLFKTIFRIGSSSHLSLIKESRKMYSRKILNLCEEDEYLIKTHLGEFGIFEGEAVPLDLPMLNEGDGLWANIRDKRERGEKPASKNSKAFKSAVKAGKKINSMDESEFKGKDVELNNPKRGGSKKFYVYVKDGDKIKKVSFGDTTGLNAKIKDKEARNAFAARHNCKDKKDRTTAGYWSCNLPRYASLLGLGANMNTYW